FMQLIAAMLGHEKPPVRVKVEPLAVAQTGRKTLLGRKPLVHLVGVVAPDSASRLKLGAGIAPRRMRHAVLYFAGVGRRPEIDKQVAAGVDREGMHGVVTGKRKTRDDRLRLFSWDDFAILQRVADDSVVDLGVKRALIERESGSAVPTFGKRLA